MDFPRLVIVAFYVLGFVLPLFGAVLVVLQASRNLMKHEVNIERAAELGVEWKAAREAIDPSRELDSRERSEGENLVNEDFHRRYAAVGLLAPSYRSADLTGDHVIGRVLRMLASRNRLNAAIIGAGLLCSTVASIWALYLPTV